MQMKTKRDTLDDYPLTCNPGGDEMTTRDNLRFLSSQRDKGHTLGATYLTYPGTSLQERERHGFALTERERESVQPIRPSVKSAETQLASTFPIRTEVLLIPSRAEHSICDVIRDVSCRRALRSSHEIAYEKAHTRSDPRVARSRALGLREHQQRWLHKPL
jgi:hypothetical protein